MKFKHLREFQVLFFQHKIRSFSNYCNIKKIIIKLLHNLLFKTLFNSICRFFQVRVLSNYIVKVLWSTKKVVELNNLKFKFPDKK